MSDLILPPGYKQGCTERTTEFGQCAAPFSTSGIKPFSRKECEKLIDRGVGQSMLKHSPFMEDQGNKTSCACEAVITGMHVVTKQAGLRVDRLSSMSIFHYVRVRGGGSNILSAMLQAHERGPLTLDLWPRDKGWQPTPPRPLMDTEAIKRRLDEWWELEDKIEEVRTALLSRQPVIFGLDGHAACGLGMEDYDTLIYQNSWNNHPAPWGPFLVDGKHGFGRLRLKSINDRYGIGAIRSTTYAGAV